MRATIALLSTIALFLAAASQAADAPIRLAGSQIAAGEALAREAAAIIGLEAPSHTPLVVIDAPPVGRQGVRLRGFVESVDVEGVAWLELWAIYGDGSRSVARTLDRKGPVVQLAGTTQRRSFALTAALGSGGARPQRLELNVGMFGSGVVSVSNLRLEPAGEAPSAAGAMLAAFRTANRPPRSGDLLVIPAMFGGLAVAAGIAARARSRLRAATLMPSLPRVR